MCSFYVTNVPPVLIPNFFMGMFDLCGGGVSYINETLLDTIPPLFSNIGSCTWPKYLIRMIPRQNITFQQSIEELKCFHSID